MIYLPASCFDKAAKRLMEEAAMIADPEKTPTETPASPDLRLLAAVRAVVDTEDYFCIWDEPAGEVHSSDPADRDKAERFELFLSREQFDELRAAFEPFRGDDD